MKTAQQRHNGEARVADLMENMDWSTSPLGSPDSWPLSLRNVFTLIQDSKFPMFLAWGPELRFLYNDAYAEILGRKHPHALGARFYDIWSEIWGDIEPLIKSAMAGVATYRENLPLVMRRKGYDEQTWFTFSYSPIEDESGQVAGMYCACHETTSVVMAQKVLREESQRLHRLFEQAPGFMAVVKGAEHRYELANKAYMQLIGQRDLIGKTVCQALPELAGQGFLELLDRVYQTGEPYIGHRMPVKLHRVPGEPLEERFVDFVYQPTVGLNGRPAGVFIQGSDVTDHKRAEEQWRAAVRQAEHARERLNALVNAAPVGIIMADAEGKLLEQNMANTEIWGEVPPHLQSLEQAGDWKGWWADNSQKHGRLLRPDEWALVRALNGEEGIQDIVEIEPFGQSDQRKIILNTAAPIRDANGVIGGAVMAQMDITKQVKAETALRESEAKFRTIADAMPQMVWSTTPDGFHDYYNRQWYDFTGVPEGSTDGDGWNGMFHPEDRARAWDVWRASLATGEPYEIHYRLRHHSGEYRWTLGRALPVRDETGQIIRWMGTCTDIHDQKLAEEELKEASQRKDEFLAMLAHELRNPLAPISTAAQLLKISAGDEKRIEEYSDILTRQVQHMTNLVDDLLDVSRVTRGLIQMERAQVDLKVVVSNAIEQTRPLIEARQHELSLKLPSAPTYVLGDRTRLVQVAVNLLNNAAKYTPTGGTISLALEVQGPQVIFTIKDNGNGISPSLLPHVFDLFIQGKRTPDRAQGGLGLGLALVKSITTLHGGHISAKCNDPEKGSTFRVALPLLDLRGLPAAEADMQPSILQSRAPVRVMIVDDNSDAARTLGSLLRLEGHEVQVKENAESVLSEPDLGSVQVFVLDIGLPGLDGLSLARVLRGREETANAVLVALTGYGQEHDRALSKEAGFDHHFVKPLPTAQLIELLARVP